MDLTNSPKISHHLWFDKEAEAVRPEASLKVAFSYKRISPDAARSKFQKRHSYLEAMINSGAMSFAVQCGCWKVLARTATHWGLFDALAGQEGG